MRALVISPEILQKLQNKHDVSRREVEQCFENRVGNYLEDTREDHRTAPPSLWFVAQTNYGRTLKVIFVYSDGSIYIKSAFEANSESIRIYEKYGK